VQHKQGPMLEENHYYPFGLAMAGICDKALKLNYTENKYRYNGGTELQNKEFSDGTGLELYDANARMYDPQIGRFGGIDALSEKTDGLSPYSFGMIDPIMFNDPTGMKSAPPDHLDNLNQLLNYVQQYGLGGFDDGFYNFQIDQGGGFSPQSYYSSDFSAAMGQNSQGTQGVWINFSFTTGSFQSQGYDAKTDATYGTMGGIVMGRQFLSLPEFANSWNSYSDDHRYKDLDWFDGTYSYDSQLQSNYQTYNERMNSGGISSVSQPGDRPSYTEGLSNWAKMYQNDQDYRTVQGLIAGAIVLPFSGAALPELGAAYDQAGYDVYNFATNSINNANYTFFSSLATYSASNLANWSTFTEMASRQYSFPNGAEIGEGITQVLDAYDTFYGNH